MRTKSLRILVAISLAVAGLVLAAPQSEAAGPVPYASITSGARHSCSLNFAGTAQCWGYNNDGQLGDGTETQRVSPVLVSGGRNYSVISAGESHTCAVTTAGVPYCWGTNTYGQLGNNSTTDANVPVTVNTGLTYATITTGVSHTCGLTTAGVAYCWGLNDNAQLGDTSTTQRLSPVAVSVTGGMTFTSISAGAYHTCAISTAGLAHCWGLNSDSQLGDTTTSQRSAPVAVNGSRTFRSISSGFGHTCALALSGSGYCWGRNSNGQLGDNTTSTRSAPVLVSQPANPHSAVSFSDLRAGWHHTCATTSQGFGFCWGSNGNGRLGDGTTTNRSVPTLITGTGVYTSIAGGRYHSCALTYSGVLCWGANAPGQLGDGSAPDIGELATVSGSHTFTQVSGGAHHSCGLTGAGVARCWGRNTYGTLGDSTLSERLTPTLVSGGLAFANISASSSHTCGVTTTNVGYCWGAGWDGRLGNTTSTDAAAPAAVSNSAGGAVAFASISAGDAHTCGLSTTSKIYCWGWNAYGQLGKGDLISSAIPVAVDAANDYIAVSAGHSHTCAIRTGGAAWCWGLNNDRQLGNNSTVQSSSPVAVNNSAGGPVTFAGIDAGNSFTCGRSTTNVLYCWGENSDGQLGDNSTTERGVPTLVNTAGTFSAVVTGTNHTCAMSATSSAMYCWGGNVQGQVGDGTTTSRSVPTLVNGGFSFTAVGIGYNHVCAVTNSAITKCWGSNSYGQLADASYEIVTPVSALTFPTASMAGLVTITVAPTLTFTIAARSAACNSVTPTAGSASSATAVSLGHLSGVTNAIAGQDLSVTTNSAVGHTIFIRQVATMTDGLGHTINDVSGTNASPSAFPAPGTEAFGYTTSDTGLGTGTADRFTNLSPKWARPTTANLEVSYASSGPVTNDSVCVAYQAGASVLTEAGTYSTTIIYTAVPVL